MKEQVVEYKPIDFMFLGRRESSQGKYLIVITGGRFFIWNGDCFQTPLDKNIKITPDEMNQLVEQRACFVCSVLNTDAAIDMYLEGTWKKIADQAEKMSEIVLRKNTIPIDLFEEQSRVDTVRDYFEFDKN